MRDIGQSIDTFFQLHVNLKLQIIPAKPVYSRSIRRQIEDAGQKRE
jgi:hypothetical protein